VLVDIGNRCAEEFKRWIPDPFVFAMLLTVLTAATAMVWVGSSPTEVVTAWYEGFWMLLAFGMQMVLILVTGYAIALSPPVTHLIDRLAARISRPGVVYLAVVAVGGMRWDWGSRNKCRCSSRQAWHGLWHNKQR